MRLFVVGGKPEAKIFLEDAMVINSRQVILGMTFDFFLCLSESHLVCLALYLELIFM